MEYSPDGQYIAWSHHDHSEPGKEVEIYLMRSDGSEQRRLTYFNQAGHPHRRQYQRFGSTNACGELDWGTDNNTIVFSISNGINGLKWPFVEPNIYILTLTEKRQWE